MKSHPRAGQYIQQLEGYRAFEPVNLPPEPPLALNNKLLALLSAADTAVGRLDGSARTLPDAELFLAMYVRQEALVSSQIEGTECTMDDILAFELLPDAGPNLDVREVVNYVAALQHGVELLKELPLCNRLLCEIHAILLRSGRGSDKSPGEFRRTQNWLGPAGCTLATASFVPPPRHVMESAMSALEKFMHDSQLPILITAGLAHAQFETIHPFLDGNGRTGRMLISLLLHEREVLVKPVLYLSTYFKRHQARYFDHLSAVRNEGEWEGWIRFFLEGVSESAKGAAQTAHAIHQLRETDRSSVLLSGAGRAGTYDVALLDAMFRQPLVNSAWVQRELSVTSPTANKALERLCELDILRETTGAKRNRTYRYDAYLDLFEDVGRIELDDTRS
jgi:Fic family protein